MAKPKQRLMRITALVLVPIGDTWPENENAEFAEYYTVPASEVKDYATDALNSWGKQCHPEDWRFSIEVKSLKVSVTL